MAALDSKTAEYVIKVNKKAMNTKPTQEEWEDSEEYGWATESLTDSQGEKITKYIRSLLSQTRTQVIEECISEFNLCAIDASSDDKAKKIYVKNGGNISIEEIKQELEYAYNNFKTIIEDIRLKMEKRKGKI